MRVAEGKHVLWCSAAFGNNFCVAWAMLQIVAGLQAEQRPRMTFSWGKMLLLMVMPDLLLFHMKRRPHTTSPRKTCMSQGCPL